MNQLSFPITAKGIKLANRQEVFRYIVDTYSAYYDAVDFVRKNDRGALILSTGDDTPYFNFCLHQNGSLQECLDEYHAVFKEHNRQPMIYITPASPLFGQNLYLQKFSDTAFMFLHNADILKEHTVSPAIRIEETQDEETFIKVWGNARKNPDDIYGAASETMINGMRRYFQKPPAGFNCFATMAFLNEVPAANVVSVYNNDFLLVIGLGTLPACRRQGLAAALMKDIVERAEKRGIKTITLQTETGTYNEQYYQKLGFVTKFNGIYYKV